jgi:uncharacterized membrane protein YkvA (DUF1232 family)
MTNRPNSRLSSQQKTGLLAELIRNAKLVWRLLKDPRVSPAIKLTVPALAAIYLIWPIDLLPDVLLGLGQLDDLAILLLGVRLFIELCPPGIVQLHRDALDGKPPPGKEQGEIVDGEYRVIE